MIETYRVINSPEKAARQLRFQARARPVWDGRRAPTYRVVHLDRVRGQIAQLLYSRDAGMHTSGWFKNPDYERCWHLSISFQVIADVLSGRVDIAPFDDDVAKLFVWLVFREWQRFIWEESAKSDHGRRLEVRHYRVFCDPSWTPIVPRGEVYSRDLTEAGWRSWSEQHPTDLSASHLQHENPDR